MRAVRPVLTALFALVLLVQTGWAAAHCLAMAAPAGHLVEICSSDGTRVVRMTADGTVLPEAPPHAEPGFCAACPLLAAPALPTPPTLSEPAWTVAEVPVPIAAARGLRPAARAPPYAPRAPPPSPDRSAAGAFARPAPTRQSDRLTMSIVTRGAACLALTGPLMGALSAPAAAHVTLEVQQAPANAIYRAVFRVPHGCEGAATTRITVQVPPGVTQALPMPKPGWRLTTTPREEVPPPAGPPPTRHGAVPEVATVTWEGGPLDHAHYDEFVVRMRLPDRPGELLYVPVVQGCEDGRSASWTQIPDPNRRPTENPTPAPALRLLPRS
ncbi:YcnI family protein [Roseomonas sp. CCTCC AB2023176]|uniref:YcnI family copper-binding membrane protein n=1 Tax=Roseomonas sp. CCTCC AB2023176 TaxID=3342640 RepID=UPI0035DBDA04